MIKISRKYKKLAFLTDFVYKTIRGWQLRYSFYLFLSKWHEHRLCIRNSIVFFLFHFLFSNHTGTAFPLLFLCVILSIFDTHSRCAKCWVLSTLNLKTANASVFMLKHSGEMIRMRYWLMKTKQNAVEFWFCLFLSPSIRFDVLPRFPRVFFVIHDRLDK